MDVRFERQRYELAKRREEGWLCDRDRELLKKITVPSLEECTDRYRASLMIETKLHETNSSLANWEQASWSKDFIEFVNVYCKQKAKGITRETDVLLCQWAIARGIPKKAIVAITGHSWRWLKVNKVSKENVLLNV